MGEKLLDTDPSLDREPLLGEMKAPVPKEDDFHDVKPLEAPESDQARNARGFGLAMGIFVTLMTYGYVQERIMTSNWDGMHGHEISSLFLVMCNRITSMMVAVSIPLSRFSPNPSLMSAPTFLTGREHPLRFHLPTRPPA